MKIKWGNLDPKIILTQDEVSFGVSYIKNLSDLYEIQNVYYLLRLEVSDTNAEKDPSNGCDPDSMDHLGSCQSIYIKTQAAVTRPNDQIFYTIVPEVDILLYLNFEGDPILESGSSGSN